jgi:hypothetical protein
VALHVSEISYWNMCGLALLGSLFAEYHSCLPALKQEDKFNRVFAMIETCMPPEERSNALASIDEKTPQESNVLAVDSGAKAWSIGGDDSAKQRIIWEVAPRFRRA